MKEKLKKINLTEISNILKSALIGVVVSILLVLLFAFVLKFVDLNSRTISLVDQIIKILSIYVYKICIYVHTYLCIYWLSCSLNKPNSSPPISLCKCCAPCLELSSPNLSCGYVSPYLRGTFLERASLVPLSKRAPLSL